MLKIALYHGYELTGSGSNEYTRYLSRTLAQLGHDVSIICGEPDPSSFPFVNRAVAHAEATNLLAKAREGRKIAGYFDDPVIRQKRLAAADELIPDLEHLVEITR